jgi:hypothetical protein
MHYHAFPPRIDCAFRALAYAHAVEAGGMAMTPHGPQATRPRPLTGAEAALRNSAAEVLRNYITGEILVPTSRRTRSARPPAGPSTLDRPTGPDLGLDEDAGQGRPAA